MKTDRRILTEEIIRAELEASKPGTLKLAIHIILIVIFLICTGISVLFFIIAWPFIGIFIGLIIIEAVRIYNYAIIRKGDYTVLLESVTDKEKLITKNYLDFNFNRSKNFNRVNVPQDIYDKACIAEEYYVVLINGYKPMLKSRFALVFPKKDWEYKMQNKI